LTVSVSTCVAQYTTNFSEEKLSLGLGVGVQYSFLGLQGKYFFSDYVGLVASSGYYNSSLLWNAGIEFRIPEEYSKRVSPYLNLLVGPNSFERLEAFVPITTLPGGPFAFLDERREFIGGTISTGIKVDAFNSNSSYLKIGFDFLIINSAHEEFVEEFNTTYGTFNEAKPKRFLPSIGYVLSLSRKTDQ
jgi:hypothetical protein